MLVRAAVTRKEYAEWDDRKPGILDAALARLAPNH
jgi:hypothetical protein